MICESGFREIDLSTSVMTQGAKLSQWWKVGRKIVAIGRNYRDHAKEMNSPVPTEPFWFLKPTTSYLPSGGTIKIPEGATDIHHEVFPSDRAMECLCDNRYRHRNRTNDQNACRQVELGVIIGSTASKVSQANAMQHVAGYCLVHSSLPLQVSYGNIFTEVLYVPTRPST